MSRNKYFIEDDEFIRGDVPMTKAEVRAVTMAKLDLYDDCTMVDIGGGTGSVSIAASKFITCGNIYIVEVKEKAIQIINRNIEKFKVDNIHVINGMAPESLDGVKKINRVFVGGSKGNLTDILEWVDVVLTDNGIIIGNFIVLENLIIFVTWLKEKQYENIEIIQVGIAKNHEINGLSMMQNSNAVYIVKGVKNAKI